MRGRLAAAVLSLALLLACRGTPAPSLPSRPTHPDTSHDAVALLQERVAALLANPSVSAGTWGVAVRSLTTHDTLVAANAHRLLTPASTLKTVTLAVAADQLGWDYTFETRLVADGVVDNGVLTGDLVAIGSGDPSLDDWDGAATVLFRSWAARLKELGITAVSGHIVGDDHLFSDEGLGPGWAWDDLAFAYSAPASALQFNEGAAQVVITPGPVEGAPATLALSPSYAGVPVHGLVHTGQRGQPAAIALRQFPRSDGVELSGTIAVDAERQVRTIAVGNPTLYFLQAVRAGLAANGVDIRGDAVDADDRREVVRSDDAAPLVRHRSPPLSSLADTMMTLSQNLYAETLLRTLGLAKAGTGSAEAGRSVVRDVLTSWGIPAGELLLADGSGLSRYNLATPNAIVSVLAHVYGDERLREQYIAALPVAGEAGTLAARMKGSAAAGNARAKTGSFSNARAVAGYVRTADGEPLAFCIMANNYGVAPAAVDQVTDAVVVSLAEFSRAHRLP